MLNKLLPEFKGSPGYPFGRSPAKVAHLFTVKQMIDQQSRYLQNLPQQSRSPIIFIVLQTLLSGYLIKIDASRGPSVVSPHPRMACDAPHGRGGTITQN